MRIITHAGLQKTGAVDYPGILSSVIFLPGCNLRCPYCHNPELVTEIDKTTLIPIDEIMAFLEKRKAVIKGVVISGGEPLIYPVEEIDELISSIQKKGFKVKLDTNGTFPEKLSLLKPDFIAMDIKTSFSRYSALTETGDNRSENSKENNFEERLRKSVKFILSSGINHEFRTTVIEDLFGDKELSELLPILKGADRWSLTPFRQGNTLNPLWKDKLPPNRPIMENFKKKIEDAGIPCTLRSL